MVGRWLHAALVILVAGLLAGAAGAIEIAGSTVARFRWDPAPGPVLAYMLFVSRNGGPFGTVPEQVVAQPFADVRGVPGESLVVSVKALSTSFEFGPLSAPSLPLRFVTKPTPPDFVVSTNDLVATVIPGFEPPIAQMSVVNGGGGTLHFQATTASPWLSVTPSSGESSVDELPLRVNFHTESLQPGEYFSWITLKAQGPGGSAFVPVRLTVETAIPTFTLSDSRISLAALEHQSPQQAIVTLTSVPLGQEYSVTSDVDWITVSPEGGTTSAPYDPITLSIDATNFSRGTYSGHLYLFPSDGRARALSTDVILTVVDPTAPRRAGVDFNHDSKADLLWRDRVTGDVQVWLMSGGARLTSARLASPGPVDEWRIVGIADFDGDARSDIVWQSTKTGGVVAWYMNGVVRTGARYLVPSIGLGWKVAAVDDFDGDGLGDILFHNATEGSLALWLMHDTAYKGFVLPDTEGAAVQRVDASGDFDANGSADVAWTSASGTRQLWLSNGATSGRSAPLRSPPEAGWEIAAAVDADGDGKSDLIWSNDRLREAMLWHFESPSVYDVQTLPSMRRPGWSLASCSDLDGDGEADMLWRSAATGQSTVWIMQGANLRQGISLTSPPPSGWEIAP